MRGRKKESPLTVTTELFRALVRGVFNLDGDSTSDFALLDHVLGLLVDLERSDLSEGNDFSLLRLGIRLDDTEGSSCSEGSLDDVASENDR